ncbi:MAG TPA: HXXEE domain-containing protein [Bryobacteraceae bacterium]|nr:HXXEE domain-containing protein [Bryobacteraceae bacterium]
MSEAHAATHRLDALHRRAWLALCAVFALHIADEALTGFLGLWNPAVLAIRRRHPWLIVPAFSFAVWIVLMILAVAGLLILSHWVRRGLRWTVYASYIFVFLMLGNALPHLGFSIYKKMWMSGAYTSPLLVAASIYLWWATARRSPYNS